MTCPVCKERPATHPELVDGRPALVCLPCRVPAGPAPREKRRYSPREDGILSLHDVIDAVRGLKEATAGAVATALRLDDTPRRRQRVYTALHRLVDLRQLSASGANANRVYRVREDAPRLGFDPRYSHRGEHNANAKLTAAEVVEIRAQLADGASRREVARRFKVTTDTVNDIARRRSWRHLDSGERAA